MHNGKNRQGKEVIMKVMSSRNDEKDKYKNRRIFIALFAILLLTFHPFIVHKLEMNYKYNLTILKYFIRYYIVIIGVSGLLITIGKVRNDHTDILYKIQILVGFYTVILLALHPLFVRDYYHDISVVKYISYYLTVLIMLAGVFIYGGIILYKQFKNKNSNFAGEIKSFGRNLTIPDVAMIGLLISILITTITSDYLYESFWGNEGRFNGLFLWLIYGAAFFIISKLLDFKKWYLDIFLFAGLLICLFGITDYFHMDIFHFKVRMPDFQKKDFMSTIGNVNAFTSYVGMVLAAAMVLFCNSEKLKKKLFYYIVMVAAIFAIIIGKSDNAYLSLAVIFGLTPLYLFRNWREIKGYVFSLATFFSVIQCIAWINLKWPDKVMWLDSLFNIISKLPYLGYLIAGLWLFYIFIYFVHKHKYKSSEKSIKWLIWAWLILIIAITGGVVFLFYDANIRGNAGRYGGIATYLVFNDTWGTYRGYIWKVALSHFKEFNLLKQLFGYGADTFGIMTSQWDLADMVEKTQLIFDSAHNEYIHYLVTIGAVGTVSYIGLLTASAVNMIRNGIKNPATMACMFAVLSYAVQAVINIAHPIVTPIMMTLLAVGLASCRVKKEENGK